MSRASFPPSTPEAPPRSRLRLHQVYYLLAAFDLLTVTLGLFVINKVTEIYIDAVDVSEVWADRLNDYSDLSELAVKVNAPGNDVFDTRDVEKESARLAVAKAEFDLKAAAVRDDLLGNVGEPHRGALISAFAEIAPAVETMVGEAQLIFSHFREGRPERAGERMAAMDQDYAEVNATLARLGRLVRDIQKAHFDDQAALARQLRLLEFAIAGLIVVMVAGVTLYGHALARRMKQAQAQREQDLRALAESEARLQAIMDNTTAVVYLKDADGRFLLVNRRFEELFHVNRLRVAGRSDYDLFPAESAAAFRANDRRVVERGAAVQFEEVAPHDDGPHTYVSVKFPLHDGSGRVYATCGISTDITERKRAEEELARHRDHLEDLVAERTAELETSNEQLRLAERLASIGTLAAGLGHDMNNVLFPVRCRLDVLEAGPLDTRARKDLADVRRSIEYLQQLAEGLRLLALDPDDPRLASGVTHLRPWSEQARPLFLAALPRGASLRLDVPEGLPPVALAPHRLTQALFNLVVNAGEAIAERGTVAVWGRALDDRRFVRIGVTDDGHGMTPEVRRQALDPFFTTKCRGLSTGLGLALVHAIARSAGGRVDIDSAPGEGTTVVLSVPAAEEAPAPASAPRGAGRRAAVSVDDARLATLLGALLESEGFQVARTDGRPSEDASLWLTQPLPQRLDEARRFLDGSASRRVIVLGGLMPEWEALGAVTLADDCGMEAIRQALRRVAAAEAEAEA